MKNKYQLLFIVSALLIIGFFATTFFSYKIASNLARNDLKYKALPLSSDNVYSEIQRDLLKPNLVSSLMAQDTFLKQWIKNGEKNILAIQTYLGSIKNKYNTSSSFFVSEQTKNYYYPEGILKKISPSNERDIWFYRVKNIVDDYESNIDIDLASNDSLTIFTNYKMTDDEGNFLGVTGVGLQTSQVSDLLISYKKKYNHDIYFVNRDNKIILSSKQNFKKENGLKQDVINRLIQEFNKNEIPTLEYIYEKEKYILNIRYIDELHLYLFIEAKEQHFTKELKNTFYKNIAIFSVIIILIMTLIIFNINYYQRRLEYLAKTDKLTSLSNRNNFDI